MRLRIPSLALLNELRIWHCSELWCRLQRWLGSDVAVAVVHASSCSSNWTPSLGTSICRGCVTEKKKKRERERGDIKAVLENDNETKIFLTRRHIFSSNYMIFLGQKVQQHIEFQWGCQLFNMSFLTRHAPCKRRKNARQIFTHFTERK